MDTRSSEQRTLLALKSSNHRDHPDEDRAGERAYHIVKFIGTSETQPAPPFDDRPRMRREVAIVEAPENEDERLKRSDKDRRPNESEESYQQRRKLKAIENRTGPRWKWVLHDGDGSNRWEGKEELVQDTDYCIIFPPSNPDEPIKDQWIEMRRYVDFSAGKKEKEQEDLRRRLRLAKELNQQSVQAFEENASAVNRSSVRRFDPLGRQKEPQEIPVWKRHQMMKDDLGGVQIDEIKRKENAISHSDELAIDRRAFDPDAFYDDNEGEDDDDEGQEEYAEADNYADIEEDAAVAHEMELNDDEEDEDVDEAEEEEESSDESGDEDEEEDAGTGRPDRSVRIAPLEAAPTYVPQMQPILQQTVFVPQKSMEEQVREFIRQTVLDSGDRYPAEKFKDLFSAISKSFTVPKETVAQIVQETIKFDKVANVFSLRV